MPSPRAILLAAVSRDLYVLMLLAAPAGVASADDLVYTYDGDVLPYDESAGWEIWNPCEGSCRESLENGYFVLRWSPYSDVAQYALPFGATLPKSPGPFWAEWRFRSNNPIPTKSI